MNSSFLSKYKPAIILALALAVFLASCKPPTTTARATTAPDPTPEKSWVVSTLAGIAGSNTEASLMAPAQRRSLTYPSAWPWIHPAISMWQIITTTAYGKSHQKGW